MHVLNLDPHICTHYNFLFFFKKGNPDEFNFLPFDLSAINFKAKSCITEIVIYFYVNKTYDLELFYN